MINEVFWSILPDKTVGEYAFMASLSVASRAGNLGYSYITSNCQRTDVARNRLCAAFRKVAKHKNDVLVMLDCDHTHPHDLIERLVAHDPTYGVVGALAFSRGEPYFPCFFLRGANGKLAHPLEFNGGLVKCSVVGTGAIAIRRWVLDAIAEAGKPAPFLYEYSDEMFASGDFQSEDITFGLICEGLNIPHYCDTSLITPHLTTSAIDQTAWLTYAEFLKARHTEQIETIKE